MKNTSITLFTIACAAYAKPLGQDQRFSSHTAQYNVEIKTAEQYRERQRIFSENDAIIEETNRKADESGSSQALRLAHNFTSTMKEDEINNMMGLKMEDTDSDRDDLELEWNRQSQSSADRAVDHFTDGFMYPVRN